MPWFVEDHQFLHMARDSTIEPETSQLLLLATMTNLLYKLFPRIVN